MPIPKLSKLELQIMEVLWKSGPCCIRDILDAFPAKKVGNVHVFEPLIARSAAQRRLVDEFLSLFGGRTQPLMTHLIESGKLTADDFKEAQKAFQKLSRQEKEKRNDSDQ